MQLEDCSHLSVDELYEIVIKCMNAIKDKTGNPFPTIVEGIYQLSIYSNNKDHIEG